MALIVINLFFYCKYEFYDGFRFQQLKSRTVNQRNNHNLYFRVAVPIPIVIFIVEWINFLTVMVQLSLKPFLSCYLLLLYPNFLILSHNMET